MPVKKTAIALGLLVLAGQIGLIMAFFQGNHAYEYTCGHVILIHKKFEKACRQIEMLQKQIDVNEARIAKTAETETKLAIFQKRYPDFSRIVDVILQKSSRFGFHPNLILGIIQLESQFNPLAISFKGAYGLMQIRYHVWKDELNIDKNRIFQVEYNIDLGLQILQKYLAENRGNIHKALLQYNNGYHTLNPLYPQKINNTVFCMNQGLQSFLLSQN